MFAALISFLEIKCNLLNVFSRGGDCECLCTAIAAYARACNEAGLCIPWRSNELCGELVALRQG